MQVTVLAVLSSSGAALVLAAFASSVRLAVAAPYILFRAALLLAKAFAPSVRLAVLAVLSSSETALVLAALAASVCLAMRRATSLSCLGTALVLAAPSAPMGDAVLSVLSSS